MGYRARLSFILSAPPRPGGALSFSFILFLLVLSPDVFADTLSLETGQGFHHSGNTQALFVRYQKDAPLLFGQQGFYEGSVGAWNGPNRVETVGIARGLRFGLGETGYLSAQFGLNYITRKTENLGTLFQFASRLTVGRSIGEYDVSLGYVHFSNGKYFFGWDGPNYGENFVTVQIGRKF
jgi:hypothetical protein